MCVLMKEDEIQRLSMRFIGPYEIVEKTWPLAYRFALNPELSQIHDVFHVSILRRYRSNPTHVLKDQEVEILENLSYVEEPFKIIGYKIKKLRNRDIPLVKVLKKNHTVKAATGEEEKLMRNKYIVNFEDKIL